MKYELEIKEEADLEITKAYLYYEEKQMGLGDKFLKLLEKYLDRICENPKHFQVKRKPYYEAYLQKFPYLVIYEIAEMRVIVYSVFNTPQNPKKKPK